MSELQTALLTIGITAIVAVYLFGWWQQRVYHRRKFGEAFKNARSDALYHGTFDKKSEPAQFNPTKITVEADLLPVVDEAATLVPDESCSILDERSDFIIEMDLHEPAPASVLETLWQRKFDFGKTVHVCGMTLTTKRWERVMGDSQTLYSAFRVALQLVDRSGLISTAKLTDFRDLVAGIADHIKAQRRIPDIQRTMHGALELDAFCVVVDQMVGVNLIPAGERLLHGTQIAEAAHAQGLSLEPDGAFHLLNARGHSLFSLINRDTKVFQHHTLANLNTAGLTLLLDVPRVENPALQFDKMLLVARNLARALQVNLVDDRRAQLTDPGLQRIRAKVSEVETKMCEYHIPPGSAQARRLFS